MVMAMRLIGMRGGLGGFTVPSDPDPDPDPPPFDPPVITNVVTVPTGAGWTDGSDCSALHQAMVDGEPDGTRFEYPGPLYTYRMDTCAAVDARAHLVFKGNATNLDVSGGPDLVNSAFVIGRFAGGSHDIAIRDFVMVGGNPDGGTESAYHVGDETASGVWILNQPSYIEVSYLTITDMYGHGVYQGSGGSGAINAPVNTWIHHNTIERVGVMGINTACVDTTLIEYNTLRDIGISPLDFEDGITGEPMKHVTVRFNTLDGWAWEPTFTAHAIAFDTDTLLDCDDFVLDGNHLLRGDLGATNTSGGTSGVISFWGDCVKTNVQILNNDSDHTEDSAGSPSVTWAWRFKTCAGIVITGNDQPIAGTTEFAHLDTCPGSDVHDNP